MGKSTTWDGINIGKSKMKQPIAEAAAAKQAIT